jgi:hypothetical protein
MGKRIKQQMALRNCYECKMLVSEKADRCPNCGARDPLGVLQLSRAIILTGEEYDCNDCEYSGHFIAKPFPNFVYAALSAIILTALGAVFYFSHHSLDYSLLGVFPIAGGMFVAIFIAHGWIATLIPLLQALISRGWVSLLLPWHWQRSFQEDKILVYSYGFYSIFKNNGIQWSFILCNLKCPACLKELTGARCHRRGQTRVLFQKNE